jgi:hypothetical protein
LAHEPFGAKIQNKIAPKIDNLAPIVELGRKNGISRKAHSGNCLIWGQISKSQKAKKLIPSEKKGRKRRMER